MQKEAERDGEEEEEEAEVQTESKGLDFFFASYSTKRASSAIVWHLAEASIRMKPASKVIIREFSC